jgi:hypothetical protein
LHAAARSEHKVWLMLLVLELPASVCMCVLCLLSVLSLCNAVQEMMAANAALLALKAQREAQQWAEEEAFRAAMMTKFAEDDRIEQLNAQKRRLKVWLPHSFNSASFKLALHVWRSQGLAIGLCAAMCRMMHTYQCRGQQINKAKSMLLLLLQIAEHKRAVDKMLEEKHAMYEAARAAEEQEEAARCVPATEATQYVLSQCQSCNLPAWLACVVTAVCILANNEAVSSCERSWAKATWRLGLVSC